MEEVVVIGVVAGVDGEVIEVEEVAVAVNKSRTVFVTDNDTLYWRKREICQWATVYHTAAEVPEQCLGDRKVSIRIGVPGPERFSWRYNHFLRLLFIVMREHYCYNA